VSSWLVAALVIVVATLPLGAAALRRPAVEGLAALQVAGTGAALALVLVAMGVHRQLFVDLGLVAGLMTFAGTVTFAAVLGRAR
jgi:multisubunit Na+/H+ antiporter MnhF subunit